MINTKYSETAKFTKMHGLGNDYIYFDCTRGNNAKIFAEPERYSIAFSDRRFSIGGDGIILLCDPLGDADFRMRMFNADGSEGKMCGNGIRCLSKLAYELGLTGKRELDIETLSGVKHIALIFDGGEVTGARVDMGAPSFEPSALPVITGLEQVVDAPLIFAGGRREICTCVSVGNPHCVIFTDDVDNYPLELLGKTVSESTELFPEGVNTEIARLMPDGSLRMRVWERGSGETFACGTGACAMFAAAIKTGRLGTKRSATVHLRGGDLDLEMNESGRIIMTGGAVVAFTGEVRL